MTSVVPVLLSSELLVKRINVRRCVYLFIVISALISSAAVTAEEWDATLLWGNKAPLGTPMSGVVTAVNVNVGDFVKQGGVLLKLDSRVQQADMSAQKAALKRAENDRDEGVREWERTQELYDRTLISDHDLEVVVIQRDAAESRYQTAKAMLVRAELDLEYTSMTAPFDAWVMSRNVAVGQTIVSRLQVEPLFVLVESGFMLARMSVSAKKMSKVQKRKKATIHVAGKKYTGQVARVALEPTTPGSENYFVDVMFDSGKTMLRAGLSAKVNF